MSEASGKNESVEPTEDEIELRLVSEMPLEEIEEELRDEFFYSFPRCCMVMSFFCLLTLCFIFVDRKGSALQLLYAVPMFAILMVIYAVTLRATSPIYESARGFAPRFLRILSRLNLFVTIPRERVEALYQRKRELLKT